MQLHRGRLIDHVHLRVRHLERTRRFYTAVFEALDLPLTASVELLRTGLPTPPATPAPGADATPQTPAAQTPAAQTPAVQTPAKAAPKRVKHRRRRKHR